MVNNFSKDKTNQLIITDIFVSKHQYEDSASADVDFGDEPSLRVEIHATHSGYVNRNFVLYTDRLLENSAHSFIDKPIMVNHSRDQRDVIGRIDSAEFVKVDNPEPGKEWTGYIKLIGTIHGKDNVKEVLNKNMLTVSIRSITAGKALARCSICGEEFKTSDDIADHEHVRGKRYDGKLCYTKLDGEFMYKHVAFVPEPADDDAKIMSIYEDSAESYSWTSEVIMKDANDKDKKQKDQKSSSDQTEGIQDDSTQDEQESNRKSEDDKEGTEDKTIENEDKDQENDNDSTDDTKEDNNEEQEEETNDDDQKTDDNEDSDETQDDESNDDESSENDESDKSDDDDDCEYCSLKFDDLSEEDKKETLKLNKIYETLVSEDEKLSAAERKKLPNSAFCGPGRSFPAHDCSHAKAGLRLLGRSDYSEDTKKKIKACLNSRKKKHCGSSDDSINDNQKRELETLDALKALLDTDVGRKYVDEHFYLKETVDDIVKRTIDSFVDSMDDATVTGKYNALASQYSKLEDQFSTTVGELTDSQYRSLKVIKFIIDDSIDDLDDIHISEDEVNNFDDTVNMILKDYFDISSENIEEEDNDSNDDNSNNDSPNKEENSLRITCFDSLSDVEKKKKLGDILKNL